nr:hypothetical protein CFP56_49040 [Quercus suber]
MEENRGLALSDVSASCFVLSKLNSGKQHHCHFGNAPSLYLRILLNGFLHWRSFVFRVIFEEESFIIYQEFFNLVDGILLGKSVHMLQYHFAFSGVPMKLKK